MRSIALLFMLCALMAGAKKRPTGPTKVAAPEAETVAPDTIRTHLSTIRLSGYDKPNQAVREAFFITNNHPDSIEITELNVTLTYSDLEGRMLHEATRTVKCHIAPGKTLRVEIPSWDRNNAFHYYRSPAPKRRASTPYRVTSHLNYILTL